MKKPLSKAQAFAAWKAKRNAEDMNRAEISLAHAIRNQKPGQIPAYGRGMKKWAAKILET